ncbi:MAG: hypothetical protein M3011_08610 [Actinomycetota bacterium]|nr:hypothetical protein [Actinomycetota bacterium]
MSDAHPDPLAESFRHTTTHVQTAVTGAARMGEAAASRAERQTRLRTASERAAREQTQAQLAATKQVVADTGRQDVAEMTMERSERGIDAATLTDTTSRAAYPSAVSPDLSPGSAASERSATGTEREAEPSGPEMGD